MCVVYTHTYHLGMGGNTDDIVALPPGRAQDWSVETFYWRNFCGGRVTNGKKNY